MRKFLSPTLKGIIMGSIPYRLLSRHQLKRHEIRFSCEVTTKCNVLCDICTRTSFIKEKGIYIADMDSRIVRRIVEEIRKFHESGRRVYFVPLGLGEPLLFKGLFELLGEVRGISEAIGIVLVTNGVLLDEPCCRELISLKIDEVTVSLNAATPSDYQRHMGLDGYDKVCSNIENLIKARGQSGKKLPRIFIQYIDYENNRRFSKKDIERWSKILGRDDKCYLHPIVNQAGFFDGGYGFNSAGKRYPCAEPLWRIAVKINGDMYPCDSSLYSGSQKIKSLYLGNIMTDSPFAMLSSRDNKQAKIVKAMRRGDYSGLAECARCNTYKLGSNAYFGLPGPIRIKGYRWL